jgi:hypothetical protein
MSEDVSIGGNGIRFCNIKDAMYWWNFNPFLIYGMWWNLNPDCNIFCQRYYIYSVYIYSAPVQ